MQEESASIKRDEELRKSMDFKMLRRDAIAASQKISGDIWTDYNHHDPGVTIIEQFCYAITDLAYRTNLDIETILFHQGNPEKVKKSNALFPADKIFPPGPLTLDDYRILLLDEFPNLIANCWINPITNHQEGIFGLYEVVLILKQSYTKTQQEKIEQKVLSFLSSNRNLCEDFEKVKILEPEKITFHVSIEIHDDEDAGELLSRILYEVEQYFNPTMDFQMLEDLESQGHGLDEIFDLPSHKHGFLTKDQLRPKRQEFYVSKIADYILAVKGVRYIKELQVYQGSIPVYGDIINVSDENYLTLGFNHSFEGQSPFEGFEINMLKGGISNNFNQDSVAYMLDVAANQSVRNYDFTKKKQKADLKIPRTKELLGYESIQKTFPGIYGLGDFTPANEDGPQRRAQAEQMKGYLLFFDQLMANHLAQLTHITELFSIENDSEKLKSYYSQLLKEQFSYSEGLLKRDLSPRNQIQQEISKLEEIKYPTDKELVALKNLRTDLTDQNKYVNRLIDELVDHSLKVKNAKNIRSYNIQNQGIFDKIAACLKQKNEIDAAEHSFKLKSKQSDNKKRRRLIDKILDLKEQASEHLDTLIERSKAAKITKNAEKRLSSDIQEILALFISLNKNFDLVKNEEKDSLQDIVKELNAQVKKLDDIIKEGLITNETQDQEEIEYLVNALRLLKNELSDPLQKIEETFAVILKKDTLLTKEEAEEYLENIDERKSELEESIEEIKSELFEELIELPHKIDLEERDLELMFQEFDHAGERKNRLLSHMLARFGEKFTTDFHIKFSTILESQNQDNINKQLIFLKSRFLQNIVEFNRDRAKGTNYLDFKNTDPIPLHAKVSILLNFEHRANQRIIKDTQEKQLKERKINRTQIKKKEVESLGEVQYRDTSEDNKVKFIVNSSNYLTYLFKYGLSKQNYKVIAEEGDSDFGIYFVPPTGEKPTKIQNRSSVKEAYATIEALIESLARINSANEGFHLVEHIIFRTDSATEHFFHLKDESGDIDFVSVGFGREDDQHRAAKDAILLASYTANYKILTNQSSKYVVYIKDATGKEVAKSSILFDTEREAKSYISNCETFFSQRKETTALKTLYELGSKNKYFFQVLNNSQEVLFNSLTPFPIQQLERNAKGMIKLATNRDNYQTKIVDEKLFVVITNNQKELAISEKGFQLDEEVELFIDQSIHYFRDEYNERFYSKLVRYLGVDGRNSDVYNYQISAVYPNWTTRFSNNEFLQLFAQTLFNCAPAHLSIIWLGSTEKK